MLWYEYGTWLQYQFGANMVLEAFKPPIIAQYFLKSQPFGQVGVCPEVWKLIQQHLHVNRWEQSGKAY